jgi:hypothetical protein
MSNIKKVFSLGLTVLALALVVGVSNVEAATITSTATGNWSAGATWVGGVAPVATDDVVIATATVVTVDASATAASVTINSPVGANGITIATGQTLTVTNALTYVANATANAQTITLAGTGSLSVGTSVTMPAPTSTGNSLVTCSGTGTVSIGTTLAMTGGAAVAGKSSLGMGTCTLTVGGLATLTGGTGLAEITSSTGILNFNAGLTFAGTLASSQLTTSGAATINLVGTLTGAGTLSLTAGTLTKTTGTSVISPILATWKNFEVVSGTTTFSAAQTVTGLQVDSGATLASGANLITNSCTSTGTAGFTINGSWTGTGGATLNGVGCTIDGTAGTNFGNTGTLTLTGAKTIASTAVLTLPGTVAISATSTITNNGTITTTAAGGITGAAADSLWTQGTTGVLNFGGATNSLLATGVLTATATGNTVNYSLAGAQTVKAPAVSYYNLTLSGGGAAVKTFGAGITVTNNISVAAATSLDLTGNSTTKYLIFNNSRKSIGSWGFTGSGATHIVTDYITAGAGKITAAYGAVTGQVIVASPSVPPVVTPATPTTPTTPTPTPKTVVCSPGQMFSTKTGEKCTSTSGEGKVFCPPGQMFNTSSGERCNAVSDLSAPGASGYTFGSATVKMGTKGEACKAWQMFLNDKSNAGLVTDGWCGKLTITAAKKWQASMGLVSDGLLGPASRAKAWAQ